MSKMKPELSDLEKICRKQTADVSFFFYCHGAKAVNPTLSTADAIRMYCERFAPGADEKNLRNKWNQMNNDLRTEKVNFENEY